MYIKLNLVWFCVLLTVLLSNLVTSQDCGFKMDMGEMNKCSAICLGRRYKCIADGVCLCQSCPNAKDNSYVHTHEDATCEFNQECSRKCAEVNSEPEYGGNIGRGKMCDFTDEFYGSQNSVCACACL